MSLKSATCKKITETLSEACAGHADYPMSADDSPNLTPLELRAFIDAMPAFAWSTRPDGFPEFVNQRLLDYSGLSLETHYPEYKSIIHRDDLDGFENWWQALMNSKKPGKTELRLRRSDGEYRWFQVSAAPVHDEHGNLIRWYGINTDIDDRKRAEEALRCAHVNCAGSGPEF